MVQIHRGLLWVGLSSAKRLLDIFGDITFEERGVILRRLTF
jgi:hypothetical protein